jgi:FAD/FMN-containing dehydrogenase
MKVAPEKIQRLEEELAGVLGTEWISRKDNSLVVQPRTVEEVAAILRKANRQGVPVRPRGEGPAGGRARSLRRVGFFSI